MRPPTRPGPIPAPNGPAPVTRPAPRERGPRPGSAPAPGPLPQLPRGRRSEPPAPGKPVCSSRGVSANGFAATPARIGWVRSARNPWAVDRRGTPAREQLPRETQRGPRSPAPGDTTPARGRRSATRRAAPARRSEPRESSSPGDPRRPRIAQPRGPRPLNGIFPGRICPYTGRGRVG